MVRLNKSLDEPSIWLLIFSSFSQNKRILMIYTGNSMVSRYMRTKTTILQIYLFRKE